MGEKLRAAFDPESFEQEGIRVIRLLARALHPDPASAVLPACSPAAEFAHWEERMAGPSVGVSSFLEEVVAQSIKLHHPRYMGHQVCAPAPAAVLAGLASEFLNNGMAVYEMGPAATALEQWIIRRTCRALDLPEGDGFLTSGGTLGTLTALLAARARAAGAACGRPLAVIASTEAHYCTARAAQVMGWGDEGVIKVAVDDRFKLRTELLPAALEEARSLGRHPVALVASAGSTSTGSYDDLAACADFCRENGLWLHVDGAHGAAVAFCPELRNRLAGIDRADSVVLDFHKLLLTPALATAVLFRRKQDSQGAFHQKAHYLFSEDESGLWRDSGRRTFECTKLSMSFKIAAIWRSCGEELIREHLLAVHGLASTLHGLLRSRPPFETALEPESNIVCFRLHPPGSDDASLDALNAGVRARVVESGAFYIVQTSLRGRVWLRTALMNPLTRPAELVAMLDAVLEASGLPET